MAERTCERWFAKFREGDRSLQNLPRSERPQILDRQSLKEAVDADSGVTSRHNQRITCVDYCSNQIKLKKPT